VADTALRLLHITDTHLHADAAARLRGVDTYRTLARVLETARGHAADAILATGDLSQDETPGSYGHFRTLVGSLGLPVWCLPGNHDAPLPMGAGLGAPPFFVGGVRRGGNWSVVLLDSFCAGDHGGRLADEHLEWLGSVLRKEQAPHVLLAIHHHPLALGSRWLDDLGLRNAEQLLAIVDRAPQVRGVVAGHVHQASDRVRNGVRYLSTPSTCFQFLPGSDAFAVDRRPPGFRRIVLMSDGSITTEVVWVEPPPDCG
jgi:Icc protein